MTKKEETELYFKYCNKLQKYKQLLNNHNENDAIWSIYNEIKLEAEIENDFQQLANVLHKMAILLYSEKKKSSNFMYASIFFKGAGNTGYNKDLFKMLKKEKADLDLEDFKDAVKKLASRFYDENLIKEIFLKLKEEI